MKRPDIEAHKKIAEAATPGEWRAGPSEGEGEKYPSLTIEHKYYYPKDDDFWKKHGNPDGFIWSSLLGCDKYDGSNPYIEEDADATHMATFDPLMVEEYHAYIEALEARHQKLKEALVKIVVLSEHGILTAIHAVAVASEALKADGD